MNPQLRSDELRTYLASLECGQWRLQFRAADPARLPPWLGSAWRGLFGHALKGIACQCDAGTETSCPLRSDCPYIQLFQPSSDGSRQFLHSTQAAPPPYVLRPDTGGKVEQDNELAVNLLLIGEGVRLAGLAIRALVYGAGKGLGRPPTPLVPTQLLAIDVHGRERPTTLNELEPTLQTGSVSLTALPPWPGRVYLKLRSPVRFRLKNRYLGPDDLTFGALVAQLLRRASLLQEFHASNGGVRARLDHRQWIDAAVSLQLGQPDFRWLDLARYSSRQRQKIPMGGVIGQCTLEGEAFEPFWPLIWLGQWLGVGKGATMGLGHYSCHTN